MVLNDDCKSSYSHVNRIVRSSANRCLKICLIVTSVSMCFANGSKPLGFVVVALNMYSESNVAYTNARLLECNTMLSSLEYSVTPSVDSLSSAQLDRILTKMKSDTGTLPTPLYGNARIALILIREQANSDDSLFIDQSGYMWYKGEVRYPSIEIMNIVERSIPTSLSTPYRKLFQRWKAHYAQLSKKRKPYKQGMLEVTSAKMGYKMRKDKR